MNELRATIRKQKEEEQRIQQQKRALESTPLNDQEFSTAWECLLDKVLSSKNTFLHAILSKGSPKYLPPSTVEIEVHNKVEESRIQLDGLELSKLAETCFYGREILFQSILREQNAPKTLLFKTDEKFNRMVEINPLLKTLKDKLDLDLLF